MGLRLHRNRLAEWATNSSSGHWLIGGHPLQLVRLPGGWMLRGTYGISEALPPLSGRVMDPGWGEAHERQGQRLNRQARAWLQSTGLDHVLFPRRAAALQELERLLGQVPPPWLDS